MKKSDVEICERCGGGIIVVSGFAHMCDVTPAVREIVGGYPHYGGGVALLLVCPGDGRHWINTTSSNPRIAEWEEQGRQIVGIVADRESADVVVKRLGEFPRCGETICKRCQAKK